MILGRWRRPDFWFLANDSSVTTKLAVHVHSYVCADPPLRDAILERFFMLVKLLAFS